MKAWFSKYFNLVFAAYLAACAVWFAYESDWNAVAGYACAAMAWGLLWFIEQVHRNTLAEVERVYNESLSIMNQGYKDDVAGLEEEYKRYVERANNA